MRILARLLDGQQRELTRVWLNKARADVDPLCCLEFCTNTLGWAYPYCAEHAREIFGVEVRPSPVHGMGLFAVREFAPRAKVVPFGGALFRNEALLDARYSRAGERDYTALYTIRVLQGFVDALELRHLWSYSNHSARPNCKYGQFGLVALRPLFFGDEILVDYGPDYRVDAGDVQYVVFEEHDAAPADLADVKFPDPPSRSKRRGRVSETKVLNRI
jgi:hypothetical protein